MVAVRIYRRKTGENNRYNEANTAIVKPNKRLVIRKKSKTVMIPTEAFQNRKEKRSAPKLLNINAAGIPMSGDNPLSVIRPWVSER